MADLVAVTIGIGLALLTGYNTFLFATLENKLVEKFDKRYASKETVEMLIRERDNWRADLTKRLESIETGINEIKEVLRERR